jgi:hypothetical protein
MSAAPEKIYCSILVRSFRLVDGARVYDEQSPEIVGVVGGEEPGPMAASRDRAVASVRNHIARLREQAEGVHVA